MPKLGRLLRQVGHYSLASLGTILAGLVSYPILTRVLKVSEYGIMGAVGLLLNISSGLSKMGLQFSIVRLWPEWAQRERGKETFVFSLFITMLVATAGVTAVYVGATAAIRPWIGSTWMFFIVLSSPLVLIRTMSSFGLCLLRSREMSKHSAGFEVTNVYAAMILAVLGATTVIGGLKGYYIGLATGELLVMLGLVLFVLRWTRLRWQHFSGSLVRSAIAFGLPMALFETIGVLLYQADRFVIIWLLDERALGYYTVAFNLAWYVNMVFTESVERAAVPVFSNLYEEEGEEATTEFLRAAIRYFSLFAMAAIAGLWVVREDILVLLASEKYRPGAALVHLLLAAFLVGGTEVLLGAGLFLKKQPWRMASVHVVSVCVNLGLNVILIPRWGLQGAAVATIVSQTTGALIFWRLGSRLVKVDLDLLAMLKHAGCAAVMAVACHAVDPGPGVLRLATRVACGIVVYAGLLVAVDAEARRLAAKVLGKLRGS